MVSDPFLQVARCLETHSRLVPADEPLCQHLNRQIAAGKLFNRLGKPLTRKLDGGLVNATRTLLYPVYDGIPQMLRDEAIALKSQDVRAPGPDANATEGQDEP